MTRIPGRNVVISGACPASTPKSPSEPGTSTWLTSPENKSFSGETRSKWKVAIGRLIPYSLLAIRSRRFRRELFAFLHCLLDGADHIEGRFRQVIIFSFAQALEPADRVGEFDKHARRAGEDFGDVEWLCQEALNLAAARDPE